LSHEHVEFHRAVSVDGARNWSANGRKFMSKGLERKKEDKKKPGKTLEEKRAAKREKKAKR
jgi:hypothetical protein